MKYYVKFLLIAIFIAGFFWIILESSTRFKSGIACFHPEKPLVYYTYGKNINQYSIHNNSTKFLGQGIAFSQDISISRDGNTLAVIGEMSNEIAVFALKEKRLTYHRVLTNKGLSSVAVSPNGEVIVAGSETRQLLVKNLAKESKKLLFAKLPIDDVAVSYSGKYFAYPDDIVTIISSDGKIIKHLHWSTMEGEPRRITSIKFNKNDTLIYAGVIGNDKACIASWEIASGQLINILPLVYKRKALNLTIDFVKEDQLATSYNGIFIIWDLKTNKEIFRKKMQSNYGIEISNNSKYIMLKSISGSYVYELKEFLNF